MQKPVLEAANKYNLRIQTQHEGIHLTTNLVNINITLSEEKNAKKNLVENRRDYLVQVLRPNFDLHNLWRIFWVEY